MPMMPRACKNGKKNYGAGEDSDNDNKGSNCKDEESNGEWESAGEHGTKAPQPSKRQSQKSTPRHKNIRAGRGKIAKNSEAKKTRRKTGGRSTAQSREVIADSEKRGCAYKPTKFCGVIMRVSPSGKTTFSAKLWNGHTEIQVSLGEHDTDVKAAQTVDAYRRVLAKKHSDDGSLKNLNFENGNFVYKAKNHGYKGITWVESQKKWQAQIHMSKEVKLHLGRFVNPDDAARAFDAKVIELKLGRALNFPKL
jgi:hypothetical protein